MWPEVEEASSSGLAEVGSSWEGVAAATGKGAGGAPAGAEGGSFVSGCH